MRNKLYDQKIPALRVAMKGKKLIKKISTDPKASNKTSSLPVEGYFK